MPLYFAQLYLTMGIAIVPCRFPIRHTFVHSQLDPDLGILVSKRMRNGHVRFNLNSMVLGICNSWINRLARMYGN